MEFDIVLVSLPAFTQKCPSLGLVSLASYLHEKQKRLFCCDYGISFYKNSIKSFKITNALVQDLNLPLYPLWGASTWVGFEQIINPKDGQCVLESLCPVCSKLYQPIFNEFREQIPLTKRILDSYVDQLVNLNSNVYGFSLLLGNAIASLHVIKQIKERKPDALIIVGGPEASPFYRASFYSQLDDVDFTIYHSEGELPVERILAYLNGEIAKQNIPGVYFQTHGKLHRTEPPPLLDLNRLPIPKFDLIETGETLHEIKALDILISKGCTSHCSFCNEPLIWGAYRPKNTLRIFEELQFYVKNYGITQFELGDNAFSSSPTFLPALEKLFHSGMEVHWRGNCKINELNDHRLLDYQKLGLQACYFGVESGSPKMQRLMGKNIDLSRASQLLNTCFQNQIESFLYFMVGFPGETTADFQKTLDFIEAHQIINDLTASVFTLMAGTPTMNSPLLKPNQLGPKTLNAFTYQTTDGVTHEDRKTRFLTLQKFWNRLKNLKT